MKNNNVKITTIAIACLIVVLSMFMLEGSTTKELTTPDASAQALGGPFGLEAKDTSGNNYSTTSVRYLNTTDTSSSTLVAYTLGAEAIDLNVQVAASSTASVLTFSYEFSNGKGNIDCVATPTQCDWYGERAYTVDSTVQSTIGAQTMRYLFTPGVTSTTTANVTIDRIGAKYTRIKFGASSANLAFFAQIVAKKPY